MLIRSLVTAVRNRRDNRILLVCNFRAGRAANVVIRRKIWGDTVVVPGHDPESRNIDFHAVVPQAADIPRRIVWRPFCHWLLATRRGGVVDAVRRAGSDEDISGWQVQVGFVPVDDWRLLGKIVSPSRYG